MDEFVYCRHCRCAWRADAWPRTLADHEATCALAIVCPLETCQAGIGERCRYPGGQTKQETHSVREKLAREFPVEPLTPPVPAIAESARGFIEQVIAASRDPRRSDAEVGRLVRTRWPRV